MSTNKRPLPSSFSSSNAPTAKRATPQPGTLTSFFPSTTGPARPPSPVVPSDPITDRLSTFVAHAAPCTNRVQAATLQAHVRALRGASHPVACDHEVLAWRCLGLKPGKTGLDSEDDWRVEGGTDDDGEKGAGAVVREVLDKEGGVDVAIVVSRLYGGVMLGPVRFAHIRAVASQALARLLAAQRLSALQSQLGTLDAAIAALSPSPAKPPPPMQYAAISVDKAERLVAAREKRLELLERKRREEEEALWKVVEAQDVGEDREGLGAAEDGERGGEPEGEGEGQGEGETEPGAGGGAGEGGDEGEPRQDGQDGTALDKASPVEEGDDGVDASNEAGA